MGKVIFLMLCWFLNGSLLHAKCVGRFVNPVTDICWKCLFPLKIAGITVVRGNPDPKSPRTPLCMCKDPFPRIGIPIAFWEPARLVDVTRTPYCLVNMGGIQLASTGTRGRGDVNQNLDTVTQHSFYQVHWYTYPLLHWLEVLVDFVCLEKSAIDLAYVTELDPLWHDDEKNAILNPEAGLFASQKSEISCQL